METNNRYTTRSSKRLRRDENSNSVPAANISLASNGSINFATRENCASTMTPMSSGKTNRTVDKTSDTRVSLENANFALSGNGSSINVTNTFNLCGNPTAHSGESTSDSPIIPNLRDGSIAERLQKISKLLSSLSPNELTNAIKDGVDRIIIDYRLSRDLDHESAYDAGKKNKFLFPAMVEDIVMNSHDTIEKLVKKQLNLEMTRVNSKLNNLDKKLIRKLKDFENTKSKSIPLRKEPWRDKNNSTPVFSTDVNLVVVVRNTNRANFDRIKNCLLAESKIRSGQHGVDYTNLHPNGNAYLHCRDLQSKETVIETLKQIGATPSTIQRKTSFIKIGPMNTATSSEEVTEAITTQNPQLSRVEIKFHSKIGIKSGAKFLVFKSSCDSCDELVRKKFLNVGLTRMAIHPFTPLIQCHKCSRFGHMINHCRHKQICCPNCGDKHCLENCTSPHNKVCGNCKRLGDTHNHHSWETCCPVRQKYLNERVLNRRKLNSSNPLISHPISKNNPNG